MSINFTKMHGLGNDFVIIDGVRQTFQPDPALIRQWADRHSGIGFDQLLLVEPTHNPKADFSYRIFNADGSEVAQCGNGARCLARFLHEENLTKKNPITVATQAGLLELKLETDGQVTVNLGVPIFEPAKIPFIAEKQATTYSLTLPPKTSLRGAGGCERSVAKQSRTLLDSGLLRRKLLAMTTSLFTHRQKNEINFSALSLGNPHCVLLVDDVDHAPVQTLGALLTKHPSFPEEVNVGFMQILNPQHIRLRVYERGAGETRACGSGACAAVIAGRLQKLLDEQVTVDLPGGSLKIYWQHENTPVYLTGSATTVFKGKI